MGRGSLASALTLSVLGLAGRAFLRYSTKSVTVKGLPVLLNALQIPEEKWDHPKGKGKAKSVGDDGGVENEKGGQGQMPPRRGIVTSESNVWFFRS
jgi:hypothetical protein